MVFTGRCLCGETSYTVDVEKFDAVGHDHCLDCQLQTGSSFSLVAVVPRSKLQIKGPLKDFAKKGDSGKDVHRLFCGNCGTPIAHQPDAAPEISALKAGTLDLQYKKELKPEIDIYVKDKLPYVSKLAKSFEKMPEH